MLHGGVIMDVVTAEEAKIAEDAGAVAVTALERVPSDIRRGGGVARMSRPGDDPQHPGGRDRPRDRQAPGDLAEAQGSKPTSPRSLTPADEANHIDKWAC